MAHAVRRGRGKKKQSAAAKWRNAPNRIKAQAYEGAAYAVNDYFVGWKDHAARYGIEIIVPELRARMEVLRSACDMCAAKKPKRKGFV